MKTYRIRLSGETKQMLGQYWQRAGDLTRMVERAVEETPEHLIRAYDGRMDSDNWGKFERIQTSIVIRGECAEIIDRLVDAQQVSASRIIEGALRAWVANVAPLPTGAKRPTRRSPNRPRRRSVTRPE
jgi:hypothetical protein